MRFFSIGESELASHRNASFFAVLLACSIGISLPHQVAAREISVAITEGTNLAIALSPNGKEIVFDLQGVLFKMAAKGGKAKAITDALFDARQPSWSPDGRTIAFQSNRGGHFRIWLVDADGRNARQLDVGADEQREPAFSPDGRWIAYTSNRNGKFDIWRRNIQDGTTNQISSGPGGNSRASWSPDGQSVAYVSDRPGATGVYAATPGGPERLLATAGVVAFGMTVPMGTPSFTPDGRHVLYARIAEGRAELMLDDAPLLTDQDIHPFRIQWASPTRFLFAANGRVREHDMVTGESHDIPFEAQLFVRRPDYRKKPSRLLDARARPVMGIQRAALSPDGRSIAFAALGNLWTMPVDGKPVPMTEGGSFVVADPSWSPDGKSIIYSTDRAGSLDLWSLDVETLATHRVTEASGAELRASWSPDGKSIVYVDAFGAYDQVVRIREMSTGADREIKDAGQSPGYPSFFPDGKRLLVSALQNESASQSYVVGGHNQLAIVPLDATPPQIVTPLPRQSIGNRSGDGPALSPDGGRIAFQMNSALYTLRIDGDGRAIGSPRKLDDFIVTGLSWAGDSHTLLAYAGGMMRLYDVESGNFRKLDLPLNWRNALAPEMLTIRVGRLVSGLDSKAKEKVDIVVRNGRIISIAPTGAGKPVGRLIDASGLTAMPGLIDSHVHLIKEYGARFGRLYLAYGITSVRSPGNVPGDVLEEKEALAAGLRPGPNMFVTGYILDGTRTIWEMGTPVSTKSEVERQVNLAATLGYDMVKSYVHTSEPLREAIVRAAHARGLHVSSHEIYPAALFGSDSLEHLDGNGAGRGYSAKTSQLNRSYQDVLALARASGIAITPTISLFSPVAELVDRDAANARARWSLQPSWVRNQPVMNFAIGPGSDILADNIRKSIFTLYRGGATILVGTDSPFTPIGINTHNELFQMVKSGLTPFEALRSATVLPAELLGASAEIGTLEPGKLADIVLVEGNPLEDITAAANVRMTVKSGRVYSIADLTSFP